MSGNRSGLGQSPGRWLGYSATNVTSIVAWKSSSLVLNNVPEVYELVVYLFVVLVCFSS